MNKTPVIAVALIFFASFACGFEIVRHEIGINVTPDGSADVSEDYFIRFSDVEDRNTFNSQAEINGSSLAAWEAYNEGISVHIGNRKTAENKTVSVNRTGQYYVRLNYDTAAGGSVFLPEDAPRTTNMNINPTAFNEFISAGNLIVPDNTSIEFSFPANASIQEPFTPGRWVEGNIIEWPPGTVATGLRLTASIPKPIAGPVDTSRFLLELLQSRELAVVIVSLAVLALIAYSKRQSISARIENYIVEHSKIEAEQEEDIDIEID